MEPNADREALLVPAGTRLVHIGPPKTGTTSLQAAMWTARDAMRAQGVRYAGQVRHSGPAVRAVVGLNSPLSDDGEIPPIAMWDELAREIRRASEPRVVLSSEFFAQADSAVIERVVRDLGSGPVHVVVTLRPLARMLASRWQQNVQNGSTASYERWLHTMFDRTDGAADGGLWQRGRHDQLIERWAEAVGRDHVTVVVVDDLDHTWVLRAFEALTGLAAGTLQLQRDLSNRSLTPAEVEALRAFNAAFKAAHLGRGLYTRLMRLGLAGYLKLQPADADQGRIETPQWALERAGEVARETVPNIAASGVRVVGDLQRLVEVPRSPLADDHVPDASIPPGVAASISLGILIGGGFAREASDKTRTLDANAAEGDDLARVPSRLIGRVIAGRMRIAAQRRVAVTRRAIWTASRRR